MGSKEGASDTLMNILVTKRYPHEVYYRLLAPHVLPESIDRVIYLDCDMLVIGSLADRALQQTLQLRVLSARSW